MTFLFSGMLHSYKYHALTDCTTGAAPGMLHSNSFLWRSQETLSLGEPSSHYLTLRVWHDRLKHPFYDHYVALGIESSFRRPVDSFPKPTVSPVLWLHFLFFIFKECFYWLISKLLFFFPTELTAADPKKFCVKWVFLNF